LPEKRLYVSTELASPFKKSGWGAFQRCVCLRILFGVNNLVALENYRKIANSAIKTAVLEG
jgi:hypothetical protein